MTNRPLLPLAMTTSLLFFSACVGEKPTMPTPTPTEAAGGATAAPAATAARGTNQPPTVIKVTVTTLGGVVDNEHPNRNDTLEARAETSDPEGDGVLVSWTWSVNGREIPGAVVDRLTPQQGGFKKGDRVTATAKARDTRGNEQGTTKSGEVVIRNIPPRITSSPASLKSYQVAATDEDGDKLRFYLERPVPGFVINSDGLLTFDSASGKAAQGQQLTIVARDDENATSKQTIVVNF